MASVALVVPCFNEEARLPVASYLSHLASSTDRILFVDDGSTDQTVQLLRHIAQQAPHGRVSVLTLGANHGKAEAVRRGMRQALEAAECELVGFWDCDLATPLSAVAQLAAELRDRPAIQMVFGARVALLGRSIRRSAKRHYLGRVFATLASLVLEMPIYDTQCGAKLFRATPTLSHVLASPFLTRWVFDIEIIARFAALSGEMESVQDSIVEFPLHTWQDVAGSKVKPTDILRMAYGLMRIRLVYFLRSWPSGEPIEEKMNSALAMVAALVLLLAFGLCVLGFLVHLLSSSCHPH
ncbi:hypothetical protein AB1Y20_016329 [Prymnesium parvum]|uniref:Glycosyltransferase 2-like domain-containing protein n=1 Tax=Prymnesium parvum TaxID=97485 RepID=A0AB34IEZ1_PRYPA